MIPLTPAPNMKITARANRKRFRGSSDMRFLHRFVRRSSLAPSGTAGAIPARSRSGRLENLLPLGRLQLEELAAHPPAPDRAVVVRGVVRLRRDGVQETPRREVAAFDQRPEDAAALAVGRADLLRENLDRLLRVAGHARLGQAGYGLDAAGGG